MSEKIFKNAGYTVFLAWDEKSCIILAQKEKPDAILMDVIFPEDDGREIVRKLKMDVQTSAIPVVFATNTINIVEDKGDETITIDGHSYRAFAKPLHYPKLLSVVRKEINRHTAS